MTAKILYKLYQTMAKVNGTHVMTEVFIFAIYTLQIMLEVKSPVFEVRGEPQVVF